ncbi:MAG: hypothetical protein LPJ89_10590 [Hymenobacteraceae bacterium]|nr:hypothetical protein [Hymenobacteraceae bacterium]MDX5396981.1 hypothetical protein [Hymenobacteraceae bacterium]MDX5444215.1 hypothetical protein [Hymenobacteraceae bacterium]MDX5513055.1 hypothetical protein [Hymenobacteraceae bacterium]
MKVLPKIRISVLALLLACLVHTGANAQKCPNAFRAGINYAFLTDVYNSGFMFYNQYNRCISRLFEVSLQANYFNASRYDDADKTFTSMKTFKMMDLSATIKPLRDSRFVLKLGAGPSIRHRAELDLKRTVANGDANTTNAYLHNKSFDYGYHGFIENDFFITDNLILGARIAGFDYNEGSGLFGFGLNMGYQF